MYPAAAFKVQKSAVWDGLCNFFEVVLIKPCSKAVLSVSDLLFASQAFHNAFTAKLPVLIIRDKHCNDEKQRYHTYAGQ